ncbi:hypothetical protein C8R45DRAFT_365193 [Mycena sanguinolenta]|nr:hypothetical protein C8R45DRAFT_365193 [Mycena sanguinolenta]
MAHLLVDHQLGLERERKARKTVPRDIPPTPFPLLVPSPSFASICSSSSSSPTRSSSSSFRNSPPCPERDRLSVMNARVYVYALVASQIADRQRTRSLAWSYTLASWLSRRVHTHVVSRCMTHCTSTSPTPTPTYMARQFSPAFPPVPSPLFHIRPSRTVTPASTRSRRRCTGSLAAQAGPRRRRERGGAAAGMRCDATWRTPINKAWAQYPELVGCDICSTRPTRTRDRR